VAGARVDVAPYKKDPADFVLWKPSTDGQPGWASPWGRGRPGWHIECSAMSAKHLGETFDIHAGGLDLIFPHHENEIAQSRSAFGHAIMAKYWMHNGFLNISGEKMSKSLGNSLLVDAMVTTIRPVELRYYLGEAHYRSEINYTPESLTEAATAYRRIEGFVTRAAELVGEVTPAGWPASFVAAMDDDLGVPQALAVVHEAVREGNSALAAADAAGTAKHLAQVRAMLGALGLDPLAGPWAAEQAGQAGDDLRSVVEALVGVALDQRQAARQRQDYAAADTIRDQLQAAGVLVEDTPRGPRWEIKR
jgi:cysteinyl-tRNA synthetase